MNDWFGFLPSQKNWIKKFDENAKRMKKAFLRNEQKCGFYDKNQLPHGGPVPGAQRKKRDIDDELRVISNNPTKS